MGPKINPTIARIANNLAASNKEKARSGGVAVGSTEATSKSAAEKPTVQADVFDYFTVVGTSLLYSADGPVNYYITLRNANPVSVGTRAAITPVQNGGGTVLKTDQTLLLPLEKGTRLYIASDAISRCSIVIAPVHATSDIALERRTLSELMALNQKMLAVLNGQGAR